MKIQLLVDAPEFWRHLRDDLRRAERSAYIQTFTFEGDRAGVALARALETSPAADRRFLVDRYSLLYHSDRIITGPAWLERPFRREVMLTHRWVARLRNAGVGVRFTNPLGPSPTNIVRRNHKKIAVFDGRIAYLGGINFSDHNFAWHDLMFRVECDALADVLAEDFVATWEGRPLAGTREVGPLTVISLNGKGNAEQMRPIIDAMAGAARSIDVVSAYLSTPFTDHLAAARSRGVRVRVLTPARNNKANLARHILEVAHRCGFEVHRCAEMSHMKAMMIDEELLVVGSTNFDFMSYHILEELVVMTRHPEMLAAFVERAWKPDLAAAPRMAVGSSRGTRLGNVAVRLGACVAGVLAAAGGLSR
jgi:cardiolipin synthase